MTDVNTEELNMARRAVEAYKYLGTLGLKLPGDTVKRGMSAPYLEEIIQGWNDFFHKYNLDYKIEMHEFKNETTFVFINFSNFTMLKGESIFDLFEPSQLVEFAANIYRAYNEKTCKNLTGYGVMKRKEFAGDPLKFPDYIGIKTYAGTIKNGYLLDGNDKKHSLNSNYIVLFKRFSTEKEMREYLESI